MDFPRSSRVSGESREVSTLASNDGEQERGLLQEWRRQNGEEQDWSEKTQKKWRPFSISAFIAVFLAVLLTLVVITASALGTQRPQQHDVEQVSDTIDTPSTPEIVTTPETTETPELVEINAVQTNDYILDIDWDYNVGPQRREYNWTIRDQEHNPDGIYRPMMLVNNQFPGPLIEVNEGDTIVVHVNNQAVNATSIHWHGMYQNGTSHMDGTVGISQCPIAPGQQFTYEFTVSGQSGSYWWHAHQGLQSSDGVHGPLIVHGKNERSLQRIPYDTDRVLLISDHYHDLSSALLWQYLKPDMENAEPVPAGGLINGRSIRNCDDFPERRCDNTSLHVGVPRIDLAPFQTHRLRLINVGAFAEFQVQIDEHELAVTEVDGTDVEPLSYHRVNINPAQRYSVIVNSSIQGPEMFWFRARMITKCFTDAPKTLESDVNAVVRFDQAFQGFPVSIDWEEALQLQCRDMNTTDLVPAEVVAAPDKPDAFFYLRSNFEIGAWKLSRGFFNASSFRPQAKSPSLHRVTDGLAAQNESFHAMDAGQQVFVNDAAFDISRELVLQTTGVQIIDFLISNFDDGNHPLHLHGYKYFVLAQGHGYPPLTKVGATITQDHLAPLYNNIDLSNPLRRDTASVEAFGWILIRLVADNPGAWAFHCHISWHSEAGLLMQMLTRTDDLARHQIPRANLELCAQPGIEKGMGPDDEDYRNIGA